MMRFPGMDRNKMESGLDIGESEGSEWLMEDIWPDEWEGWRISEEAFAKAYDAISPEQRARIKTVLALVRAVHGEEAMLAEERIIKSGTGFGYARRTIPAPWALLVAEPRTFSAIHMAAAIMPAHLAGVRHVAALWTGETPVPETVLAALELSGVEHAFVLPPLADLKSVLAGLIMYFEKLAKTLGVKNACQPVLNKPGRLLFPGNGITVPLEKNILHTRLTVPVWEENVARHGNMSLNLPPELAGLWVHPDLPPSFFLNTEMTVFFTDIHHIAPQGKAP